MTEIALHEDNQLSAKIEWAKTMAVASLLPREYQNNPGNLLYAIEYADSLGIDRINAITSIHVINGKPSASADLIAGLIRKAGHKLRITGDEKHAVAQLIRSDDPDFTYEARWDEGKARAAGLWGGGNWKKYPGAMLRARAITEVARMGASDALYGVIYTPEELGADVAPAEPQSGRERLRTALAEPIAAPLPQSPAGIDPNPVDAITPKQIKAIATLAGKLGLSREQKIAGAAAHAGRPIETTNDLTATEAGKVLEALTAKLAEREAIEVIEGELVGTLPQSGADIDPNAGAL